MTKTSEKVTKDPKRQERGKKWHEKYTNRLKEKILEDNQLLTPSPTDKPTSSNSSHAAKSNNTYVYGVGILAVLAIGVCVFVACNTSKAKNKKTRQWKTGSTTKRTSYALDLMTYTTNE